MLHIAAFPAVSIGKRSVMTAETMNSAAETKMGPFAVPFLAAPDLVVVAILMTGARIPVIRLNEEHKASPVPR